MSEGIVYVLTNPAMEGYVKIGRTNNLQQRMQALWSSGVVPAEFICYYAGRVDDMEEVERNLHEIFGDKRVHPRREFFTADPHRVARAIRMVATAEVVDATQPSEEDMTAGKRMDAVRERRDNFDFTVADVPIGAELKFVERDETCQVVELKPPRVEYQGGVMSLSAAAREVLGTSYGPNGTLYWQYDGETIWERRERLSI